ncbi:hypothetical protein HPB48_018055 [Haemaphysalis longicornis]|uniref:ABC transporter n=1 Tax=Haemaphysalis longicornis TaxID=44386 RepID=A0A9J6FQF9_HAELO|nr:hypothetical protein HPB48_018055 [Haemaphysalis longicornis]
MSRVLHHEMLEHVLFSPMSFFDCTPRGRILNRFTADLSDIDIRMASLGRQTIQSGFLALSRLAVIGSESPVVVGIGVFVFIVFVVGLVVLIHAVNVMRFIRSTSFSRLLHHTTETVESLTTVRVFGMTQRFYGRFCGLANETLRASLASVACQRLTRTFAIACSQTVVLATLVFTVVAVGSSDEAAQVPQSSSIGLALSSSLGEEVEKAPTTNTSGLSPSSKGSSALPLHKLDWPSEGRVEFQNFSASYRPQVLDNSLKNVSFTVYPREKLVCLARALLRRSRILVLDEATSQMDGDTDSLIQATLRESFANFTLLTVAHRLHTVLDYDRILVMGDGTVVEYGPVDLLLNNSSSTFYDMALKAGIVSGTARAASYCSEATTKM